jgi:sortase (surface protein transpeptidase)
MRLTATIQKIPLFIKVVSLYLLVAFPLYTFAIPAPAESIDTNQYISEAIVIEEKAPEPQAILGTPDKLVIPRLGINLPIADGVYDVETQSWTLTKTAVHYAVMTSKPNDLSGNTLIYGHNTVQLLSPTRLLQPGDTLQVTSKEGYIYNYVYVADNKVDPSDTSVLTKSCR